MEDNNAPSTPGNEASGFTAMETKLICAVMQNLTSDIQFDVDKVAGILGYKSGHSLRARWNTLKRTKINTASTATDSTGGVDKSTPSKKAKSTPKKAKAASEEGAEPKSTGKKGKAKGKSKVKVEEEDEAVESIEGSSGVAVGGAKTDGENE